MFHVGQKVVCIKGTRNPIPEILHRPVVGSVYTVRAIISDGRCNGEIVEGLIFEELINPFHLGARHEYNFVSSRFRPVRTTDISVFTALLKTAPVRQSEAV